MQATQGSSLHTYQQASCLALRPIVRRFLIVEFPSIHRDAHLPETDAVAAFSFRGACQIDGIQLAPPAAFTGPRVVLRTHEHRHSHAVLLATFTPVGAYTFLRSPLDQFAGSTFSLENLVQRPEDLQRVSEQLAAAQHHRQRIAVVEDFLLRRVRAFSPDPLITAAVAWLEQAPTGSKIDDLTRYIGLSQSALERRFRRIVGVSPKKYVSLVRLRRAVRLHTAGADLTTVAHTAGYFDQSHFIKDFRRVTGLAPSKFFRRIPAE